MYYTIIFFFFFGFGIYIEDCSRIKNFQESSIYLVMTISVFYMGCYGDLSLGGLVAMILRVISYNCPKRDKTCVQS